MTINREGIEQGDSPITPPEGDIEEQEMPEPLQTSKWNWIGSPDRPEAKETSDGISDLFDVDNDQITDDVDELVDVDYEKDILDANDGGDLEDLVNVSNEDIMGVSPRPKPRYRLATRRSTRRYDSQSPTMGGMSG